MTRGIAVFAVAACLLGVAPGLEAQGRGGGRGNGGGRGAAASTEPPEEGIPVTDALTISRCSGCHKKDDKGNLSRISWSRTTPEGWEEAIKRMVRLNGVKLEPADAKAILKYLSNYHGLAPEEAKPVMYMAEHRIQDEAIPNESVRATCMNCHALGRPFSWRRTREEWSLLADMHVALYQQAEAAFRRGSFGRCDYGTAGAARQRPVAAAAAADLTGSDAGFPGQDLSAAHAGMGGMAGSHARSTDHGQVAGDGAHRRAGENISAR